MHLGFSFGGIMKQVSSYYLDGIKQGREVLNNHGAGDAMFMLDNLNATIKRFPASSPVGQQLRGERDFWKNQLKTK